MDNVYRTDYDDEYIRNPYNASRRYNPKTKEHNMTQDEVDYITATLGR